MIINCLPIYLSVGSLGFLELLRWSFSGVCCGLGFWLLITHRRRGFLFVDIFNQNISVPVSVCVFNSGLSADFTSNGNNLEIASQVDVL